MGFLNRQIHELDQFYDKAPIRDRLFEKVLGDALNFYKLAERRDQIFLGLMRRHMRNQSESTAILVTGGYHSSNIKRLLRLFLLFFPQS